MQYVIGCFNSWLDMASGYHLLGVFMLAVGIGLFALFSEEDTPVLPEFKAFGQRFKSELIYSAGLIVLLLFPFSAYVFTKFQSVFYSYAYLWYMVPVIPLTALFLFYFMKWLRRRRRLVSIPVLVLCTLFLLLCSSLAQDEWKEDELPTLSVDYGYEASGPVLNYLSEVSSAEYGDSLTILAPPSVTKYIRLYCGNVATLYGKDLWDKSAQAYNYTEYSEEVTSLYTWECYCDFYGDLYYTDKYTLPNEGNREGLDYSAMDLSASYISGLKCFELARSLGADAVVIHGSENTDTAALLYIEQALSASTVYIPITEDEGYYIIFI